MYRWVQKKQSQFLRLNIKIENLRFITDLCLKYVLMNIAIQSHKNVDYTVNLTTACLIHL